MSLKKQISQILFSNQYSWLSIKEIEKQLKKPPLASEIAQAALSLAREDGASVRGDYIKNPVSGTRFKWAC